jgi:hypothetical protein
VLTLHRMGDVARARSALALLQRYVGGPSLPADSAEREAALQFAIARELDTVAELPEGLRREVARGALTNDFSGVPGALVIAERDHGGRSVRRLRARLKTEAPMIAGLLGPPLRLRSGFAPWTFVPILLFVVRIVATHAFEASDSPSPAQLPALLPTSTVATPRTPFGRASGLAELRDQATRLCGSDDLRVVGARVSAPDARNLSFCSRLLTAVDQALAASSCDPVREQLDALGAEAAAATPTANTFVRALRALVSRCQP